MVDDTPDHSTAQRVRDAVNAADASARLVDLADRIALADHLAISSGASVDAVRWALVGPPSPRFGAGSGRNTLAFCLAGSRAVTADDDILPRFARPPGYLPGWRLTSRCAFETWPFDDADGPEAFASFGTGDPIADAERCVGRAVGDVLPHAGVSRFEAAGLPLTRRLRGGVVRVPCAVIGIAGDTGTDDALGPLLSLGPTGERAVRRASALGPSREVARTVQMATLTDHPSMFGGFRIDDLRMPLAPWFPSGRGENDAQSRLIRRFIPDSVTAVLPWMVLHRPPGSRTWAPADFIAAPTGLSDQLALMTCADTCPEPADGISPSLRRHFVGSHLEWLGGLPSGEFDGILADGWHAHLAATVRSITVALEAYPVRPPWWQHTLRRALVAVRQTQRGRPPLTDRPHDSAAAQSLQADVRRFGLILQAFDDLHAAARELYDPPR